ncbi:MAG: S-methyl-5'-thioadenosine phosphorylase [Candidatus Thermoplasmatota archaeon]|jgi:5'-methylthioadenosine phosphorylase|nr:S-methyl-5'-thioadenosine phosphorylase [Candidatus Thermoplasmatota archaeon]MCL5984368.1 S-methyl-5'-thioadenosine phosphorylase [Candidatus Thermoplasmatota archaeon]
MNEGKISPDSDPTDAVVGIIGGSGLYESGLFRSTTVHKLSTPWGSPSGFIEEGRLGNLKVFFLPRHGKGHTIPAHKVNYRANIDALKSLGVNAILSVNSVGSLKEELPPGSFVVPDQFLDFTKSRPTTFYEGGKTYHISMADPFCPRLSQLALAAGEKTGIEIARQKTYVCVEGPRFSTRAESKFYRTLADVIGMTLCPEAQLAREREICYLPVCMVTDFDVWAEHPVEATDISATLSRNIDRVRSLLLDLVPTVPPTQARKCGCRTALAQAGL